MWNQETTSRLGQGARQLAQDLGELAWPTRCVGCDEPGELLCPGCRASLPWITQRTACPNCGAPHGFLTCTECGAHLAQSDHHEVGCWETRCTICALTFRGTAALMTTALKDAHELRLAPVIAAAMATALDEAAPWPARDGRPRFDPDRLDALCFVPATAAAYARRGFDHMELVAHSLSAQTGVPLADVLARAEASDQRELGREGRIRNLRGTVVVTDDVAGAHVLLADDVVTTGATLREAARALLARGAASVTACGLARVW